MLPDALTIGIKVFHEPTEFYTLAILASEALLRKNKEFR